MTNIEFAANRAKVYHLLSDAFLYPRDNWLADLPTLFEILDAMAVAPGPDLPELELDALQAEHRRALGVTGSLCYETEYGLPHEFRQSQELADIAGFYHAFGFKIGGAVRERPDHLAAELEFMYLLALKEAYALARAEAEHAEICSDAQRKFLRDHLGRWMNLFAERVAQNSPNSVYQQLAAFAAAFVRADAERLGASIEFQALTQILPTPPPEDLICGECPANAPRPTTDWQDYGLA